MGLPEVVLPKSRLPYQPHEYQTHCTEFILENNAAVLSNKLLQMLGGTVYDEYKDVHQIHDRKLDALEDLIEAVKARMENLKKCSTNHSTSYVPTVFR